MNAAQNLGWANGVFPLRRLGLGLLRFGDEVEARDGEQQNQTGDAGHR